MTVNFTPRQLDLIREQMIFATCNSRKSAIDSAYRNLPDLAEKYLDLADEYEEIQFILDDSRTPEYLNKEDTQ